VDKNLLEKIREICYGRECCLKCPLYKDDCMIVKMPFRWDVQAIEKAIKEYENDMYNGTYNSER